MNIEKLKEIAAIYGLVIAETEADSKAFERMGYQKLDFDVAKLFPELFISYDPNINFYGKCKKEIYTAHRKAFLFAA